MSEEKSGDSENIESNYCKDEKSIKAMYNELVRLYDLEMDAHDTIKDKTNGIIAFNGAIISLVTLAFIQLIGKHPDINFYLYLFIIPFVCLFVSLLLAILSYRVVELVVIDAKALLNEYYCKPEMEILSQLCANIADDIDENKVISGKRAMLFDYSFIALFIGLLAFVVIFLVLILSMNFDFAMNANFTS
jgi:hypothetical protein